MLLCSCTHTGVTVFPGGWFGEGYGSIFLHMTNCTGRESRLIDCVIDTDTSRDTHALDAGLRCSGSRHNGKHIIHVLYCID